MLSSFQHPRRSIFLSLEHVTLSSPFLHSCPLTRICTDVHTHSHTPTRKHGTSMAQSPDGPLWDKNTRCFSKASFIHSKQKDGFTSALFPPLGPGLGLFSPCPLLTPSSSHPDWVLSTRGNGGARYALYAHMCPCWFTLSDSPSLQ